MDEREQYRSALRPTKTGLCIVMVCTDMSVAEQVARQLRQVNSGCLVTYRRAEDLMNNAPTGNVTLVILATEDDPATIRRTLKWLRHRWHNCPITVVGDGRQVEYEMAAREGGAFYLTQPVSPEEWSALLIHALGGQDRVKLRESPGRSSAAQTGSD